MCTVMLHPLVRNDTIIDWEYIVDKWVEMKNFDFNDFRDLISLENVQECIDYKLQGFKSILTCLFSINDTGCGWSVNDHLLFFVLFNFTSLISVDWNRAVKPTVYEKVNNLILYKVTPPPHYCFEKRILLISIHSEHPISTVDFKICITWGCICWLEQSYYMFYLFFLFYGKI